MCIAHNNTVVAYDIVWVIVDGQCDDKVRRRSVCNSLCHLGAVSINSEVDSIPLPCDFSGRGCSCLTGKL